MRTLYLLRHAKSEWDQPELDDYDRPLSPRGRAAAPAMGALMGRRGMAPDLALCSTAARAQQRALLAFNAAGGPARVEYRRDLYLAAPDRILAILRVAAGSAESAMVIGHNPGLEMLAAQLVGDGDADARLRIAEKYPTGALAAIVFGAASWGDIAPGDGRLDAFLTPRNDAG